MDIPLWLSIILLVVAVLFTAFFSGAETAFACVNKYKYKALAKENDRNAKLIVSLIERFDSTLITVLIGNNVCAIFISVLSTFLFVDLLSPYLSDFVVSLIISIAMAFIIFLLGDTIPKLIAKKIPDAFVKVFVFPLTFFKILFYPLTIVFKGLNTLFQKLFRGKKDPELTEDDFSDAVDLAEEEGLFEENESEIIQNTLDFDDTRVAEVLTPLKKTVMLDASGLTKEKLIEFLKECRFSRIPIYYKNKNKIVGVLVVKDFLSEYFASPRTANFLAHLKKPHFVKPSIKMDDLIDFFRENQTQIAFVRKNDVILGMVTTEDVLEELVGAINEKENKIEGGAQ